MGRLDDIDLKVNPEPRAACLLLLDTSGSMDGARIAELQEGLRVLQNDLLQDSLAEKRVEIGIVTFGDTVRVVQDFVTARELQIPSLAAGGNTPLGGALRRGLAANHFVLNKGRIQAARWSPSLRNRPPAGRPGWSDKGRENTR